jgi:ATP-dependent RNA helicase SUPV3L1/SUV3
MPAYRPVTAVLGPTNTGKTHLAVERMLAHGGGMIGLPLRLLAREIYDKVRAKAGDHAVALVTGEEKIIPVAPRYWVCTVEAMPPDVEVPFLAIDEVQLAADFDRGHIFTDRILNRRGFEETMLLGAGTMRGILERMLPKTTFISRPRFSKLAYAGQKKLSRLPRRSAIVAFTAEMVYAVAELIRTQRGGAAVVMGALSPRTRNAQVALYQSGDVDYLVATDAIGMGLNMDVDHVALAATRKFDGFQFRNLNPAELGQIAGRAGRYMNDGTFGLSGDAEQLDQDVIDRLENHNFESIRTLQWRNRDLDFRSLDGLRKSLGTLPKAEGFTRAQPAADIKALEAICRDESIRSLVETPAQVTQAWDVCQVPDYRNISPAEHAHLVGRIITFLRTGKGHISEDWFARQLSHCENLEGGIDALSTRISHVRTWTFVANRSDWLEAPAFWQGRAKEIEDRLSDVLHERLTQRFIDRKTSVLMRRLAKKEGLMSTVEEDGSITVEGERLGAIQGLSFLPEAAFASAEARLLKSAATQALAQELAHRARALAMTADPELRLNRLGELIWQKHVVGKLAAGDATYRPRIDLIADEALQTADREQVLERLQKFVSRQIDALIGPLVKLEEPEGLEGLARGLAFRISENFGVLAREDVAADVKSLSQDDRAKLRGFGIRFGAFTLFAPPLLKPAASDLRLLLWSLKTKLGEIPQAPANGLTSATADASKPEGFYRVCGYRICGGRAVRVDMLERLADLIRDRVFWKPRMPEEKRPEGSAEGGGFTITPDLMSLVGCSGDEFRKILESLGFRAQKKQVAKPQAVPQTTVAPVEPAPDAPAVEVIVDPVEPAPEPIAQEPVAQEPVAPEPDIVEMSSEPLALSTPEESQPATEMIEIEVWWPRDTGPFRHEHRKEQASRHHRPQRPVRTDSATATPAEGQTEQKHERPHGDRPRGKRPDKKFDKPRHDGPRPDRPRHEKPRVENHPRPERPPDPNSPFAVLQALKARMKDN